MLPVLLFALATAAPAPLKVLVLDVVSSDMTESERTTLTNLEAAHLSQEPRLEVLSGEDLKQMMKLQGQAQELGVVGNCAADACMAELAGALGAGVVISTQAGKLGETYVVTIVIFDAAKAKGVARRSIHSSSLGELPALFGPALDALVRPLLPLTTTAMTTTTTTTPAVATKTTPAMSARVKELYDVEAMQICVDKDDRAAWWFCNRKRVFTENAFVREYRSLTGVHDVDHGEVSRGDASELIAPVSLFTLGVAGAAGVGVVLTCGLGACGADAEAALRPEEDNFFLPVMLVSIFATIGGLTGGAITAENITDAEGTPRMHTLSEGEGRGAVSRYNRALRVKLTREIGG